jgi:hypothetical protein
MEDREMSGFRQTIIVTVSTVLVALPVQAHHSTTMYDRASPITIEAEVVEFRWVNPHSHLTVVERAGADGAGKTWSIEMSSPGVLTRNGFTRRTFNAGDRITLTFGPLRNGDPGGILLRAVLADGKALTYSVELPIE